MKATIKKASEIEQMLSEHFENQINDQLKSIEYKIIQQMKYNAKSGGIFLDNWDLAKNRERIVAELTQAGYEVVVKTNEKTEKLETYVQWKVE